MLHFLIFGQVCSSWSLTSITVDILTLVIYSLFTMCASFSFRTITLVAKRGVGRADLVSGAGVLVTAPGVEKAIVT